MACGENDGKLMGGEEEIKENEVTKTRRKDGRHSQGHRYQASSLASSMLQVDITGRRAT